jgi:oligoendopeptidase F
MTYAAGVGGQQPSPIPARDSVAPYRYDAERYLFATPEEEVAQRSRLADRIKELARARVHMTESANALYHTLVLADSLQADASRHSTYLYVRTQQNSLDEASATAKSAINDETKAALDAVRAELRRLGTESLRRFIAEQPALAAYRFVITLAQRQAPHVLSAEQQEVVSHLAPYATDWQQMLYHRLIERTAFGTVRAGSVTLDVYRQRSAIVNSPDSAVRDAGSRLLWAGYNSQRDLYAMALTATVRAKNALAKERHFEDAPAESYFKSYLTTEDVRALLNRVRPRAELWKRYQMAVAAHSRWAMARQSMVPTRRAMLTVDSASRLIAGAVAPLGPQYQREIVSLFDPASGRLDATGGKHRAAGGTSLGAGFGTSGVYLYGFDGYYADVSRLAHEAGHAIEGQLLYEAQIPASYKSGAPYLSESYALLNELILADGLYRAATTNADRQYYLTQFLSIAMEVFHGAQDADLEQSVYDGVSGGRVTTADDLDSLTRHVDESYTIYGATRPALRARWITARLMFEDPLYLYNYLYSGILALKLFERFAADPGRFAPRYLELLRAGYQRAPADALKHSLGIDMSDPKLLDQGVALLEARVADLEKLYAKQQSEKR